MANKYSNLPLLKSHGQVTVSTEDNIIQSCLDWAELEFERLCGSQFDQANVVGEIPSRGWMTRDGTINLIALERGPITAVSSIEYRVLRSGTVWNTIAWGNDDLILPPSHSPPHPRAWMVTIFPNNLSVGALASGAADDVLFRWSYTGGYAVIPDGLPEIINRMAWWKYKLREAPLGKVSSPPFGISEIIPSLPADIKTDIMLWSKVALG